MDSIISKLAMGLMLSLLLTGCMNDYLTVKPLDKQTAKRVDDYNYEQQLLKEGKRPSIWGECDYWKVFTLHSSNDVDTSELRLKDSGIIDVATLPHSSDKLINHQIYLHWVSGIYQPGIRYATPPRYAWVQVNRFNQRGVVSYMVSRANRGSVIRVMYCVGGNKGLGYYLPERLKKPFEQVLRAKFVHALKQAE